MPTSTALAELGVMKLDLEGAELGALKSGEKLIERDRPAIMFESGQTDYMRDTKEAQFQWFDKQGSPPISHARPVGRI